MSNEKGLWTVDDFLRQAKYQREFHYDVKFGYEKSSRSEFVRLATGEEKLYHYTENRAYFQLGEQSILLPAVDSLNLLEINTDDPLFPTLTKLGFESPLINSFSEQETSAELSNPVLVFSIQGFPLLTRSIYNSKSQKLKYLYNLPNGLGSFHMIMALDPEFWSRVVSSRSTHNTFEYGRLDLAVDFKENVLKHISKNMVKGHYKAPSCRPRGVFIYDGVKVNQPIGKRSKLMKDVRKQDKPFTLETLYLGQENLPVSVIIYDKVAQMSEKKHSTWDYSTRIEARFNFLGARDKAKEEDLALTMTPEDADLILSKYNAREGLLKRLEKFFAAVQAKINFTTSGGPLAPSCAWWDKKFIRPLNAACGFLRSAELEVNLATPMTVFDENRALVKLEIEPSPSKPLLPPPNHPTY